jgi:hypothetical protein
VLVQALGLLTPLGLAPLALALLALALLVLVDLALALLALLALRSLALRSLVRVLLVLGRLAPGLYQQARLPPPGRRPDLQSHWSCFRNQRQKVPE